MKRSLLNKVTHAFVTGALTLTCFQQTAIASETGKDVSKEISELRSTALYAELYLIGSNFNPNHDLDLVDVIRVGCHYKVTNRDDITSLIKVVSDATINQVPPIQGELDSRVLLRIYKDDKQYTSLVVGQDYTDGPAKGRYFGPSVGAVTEIPPSVLYVEVKNGLQKSLLFWGAQHAALAVKPCHQ